MGNNGWETLPLGEVTNNFDSERVPVRESDRRAGIYPYYGASGIIDYVDAYIFDGEYLLVAEDGENLQSRKTQVAFMASGQFWVNNHAHIVQGNDRALSKFLYYFLQDADIFGYITGSAQPKLNQENLNRIAVLCPPISEQIEIVLILGALDDKIELNRRMNRTLEAMAQALFISWFVDFDPVTAKSEGRTPFGISAETAALFPAEFVDSELGAIPKGWKVGKLSDIAQVTSGKRPGERSTEKTYELQVPLFGGGGIMAFVREPLYSQPVLITGRVGTIGQVYRISYPCWASDNTLVLLAKQPDYFEYVYFILLEANFGEITRGSTQPLITQSDIQAQKIVVAPELVVQAFHNIAHLLLEKIDHNNLENTTLANIRDALLPRLLSGEVRVKV